MTRLGYWLRRFSDRVRTLFRRSPDPPVRLEEEVILFRSFYPGATPDQWEAFAVKLAENAHRDGFARGFQWGRNGWTLHDANPDRMAEQAQAAESLGEAHPYAARLLKARGDENDPLYAVSEPDRAAFFALLEAKPFYVSQDETDEE